MSDLQTPQTEKKRRINALTINDKMKIVKFVDENPKLKKNEIAAKFGLPCSTLSSMVKNRLSIERCSNKKYKRNRKCTFPDVDECLGRWYLQCRDQGIAVNGIILRQKAQEFAQTLGYTTEFKASNGWLERFKSRHDVGSIARKPRKKTAPETQTESCNDEWIMNFPSLVQHYEPVDIFNAAETGLFYQCFPDKIPTFQGEEYHYSKVRITILFAANQTGTEKLPPLVIGHSANLSCFSNVKSFPMPYRANKNAWMTSEIFSDWLKGIDKSMVERNRKILLVIDSCAVHSNLPVLQNIAINFLPPDTLPEFKPLHHGVIESFKFGYRRQLIRKLLDSIDNGNTLPTVNILDAMRMIDYAWRNVTENTIKNSFLRAGFKQWSTNDFGQLNCVVVPEVEANECDEWMILKSKINLNISFVDYLNIDKFLATSGVLTDAEIVDNVRNDSVDDEQTNAHIISTKEAEKAVETLRTFLESQQDTSQDEFAALANIHSIVQSKKVRQMKWMTNYFG